MNIICIMCILISFYTDMIIHFIYVHTYTQIQWSSQRSQFADSLAPAMTNSSLFLLWLLSVWERRKRWRRRRREGGGARQALLWMGHNPAGPKPHSISVSVCSFFPDAFSHFLLFLTLSPPHSLFFSHSPALFNALFFCFSSVILVWLQQASFPLKLQYPFYWTLLSLFPQ